MRWRTKAMVPAVIGLAKLVPLASTYPLGSDSPIVASERPSGTAAPRMLTPGAVTSGLMTRKRALGCPFGPRELKPAMPGWDAESAALDAMRNGRAEMSPVVGTFVAT